MTDETRQDEPGVVTKLSPRSVGDTVARMTRLLADKTGAALVVVPGGTGERERYLDHLRDVADKILAALSR